ncbi:MAG: methyltransferase domain-containing protein [Thaumarchaeota archaeon]|nr:methyltransferase domain-containing protein [Nitrososphaerota archaeon]
MNPLSKVFLYTRHDYVRNNLPHSKNLDIGAGLHPVTRDSFTVDTEAWKKPDEIASVMDLPFSDRTFDSATLLEVIEHVPPEDQVGALKEVKRVVKQDGTVILSTPYITNRTKALWIIVWWFWENTVQKEYRHKHIGQLHFNDLLRKVRESGLVPLSSKRFCIFDVVVICRA